MKEFLSKLFTGLFVVYFIGSAYYFNYLNNVDFDENKLKYFFTSRTKNHYKSLIWPYYIWKEFSQKNLSEKEIANLKNFIDSYQFHIESIKIGDSDPLRYFGAFKNSIDKISFCERNTLNNLYPDFGDKVFDNYKKGLDLFYESIQQHAFNSKPSINSLIKGDNLIKEFYQWYSKHQNNLNKVFSLIPMVNKKS
jgi:hypothetical protein